MIRTTGGIKEQRRDVKMRPSSITGRREWVKWQWGGVKGNEKTLNGNEEALKGNEEALKGNQEAIRGEEEAFVCDGIR